MRQFGTALCLLMVMFFLGWAGTRIYSAVIFDRECEGRLKRAADANTVELAKQEMEVAVAYLERNEMTTGYTTAILWRTPDEDVGYWYSNLKSSLEELRTVSPQATQLEKSNVLMKLRETLIDHSKDGDSITAPEGISIFPYNTSFFLWPILSIIFALIGALFFLRNE